MQPLKDFVLPPACESSLSPVGSCLHVGLLPGPGKLDDHVFS